MFIIEADNVRDALPKAVNLLFMCGQPESTRNGPALVAQEPVTIHYKFPQQRVLLNPFRDANPFFHLMESIWMLAGESEGTFLDPYIKNFSKNFGDENGFIQDAYGYRWRFGYDGDQLHEIIKQLKNDPTTRQCVLQMWGAGRKDLWEEKWKPCNLVATFRIVKDRLNMMVANRSNDLIWGACGANAVHFSFLQEYLAGMIGVDIGEYWQVSSNLHLYQEHVQMFYERIGLSVDLSRNLASHLKTEGLYGTTMGLVIDRKTFDNELQVTFDYLNELHGGTIENPKHPGPMANLFLSDVVINMAIAHFFHRTGEPQAAINIVKQVPAQDWREAGLEWLERRHARS